MLVEGVSQMLWDFGFRHHKELQTVWIEGTAGLGTIAKLVDKQPKDTFSENAERFLSENNPELLEAIRKVSPQEREALLKKLEGNFENLRGVIEALKEG